MKVVIIGGGIAGLTLGAFLHKKGMEVSINERTAGMPIRGHAFLMHADGIATLEALSPDKGSTLPGKTVNTFSLRRPNGKEIKHLKLYSWKCIKRRDLIKFLYTLLPKDTIVEGRDFSHFIYEDDKAVAAVFANGRIEYGDIFIGADGGNSKVRDAIFGKVKFTPVEVKEVVGIAYNEKIAKTNAALFTKFQDNTTGLAFGLIPTSHEEFVWFMQYDPNVADVTDSTPDELGLFCNRLLRHFPPVVADIMDSNDFSTSYVWNTRDFDLLPAFHKNNIAIIGDAAHLALPFTSAGTTNAIVDAQTLANFLGDGNDYENAFIRYYNTRAVEVEKHIHLGRELKKIFLNPTVQNDDDIPVPLISKKGNADLDASKQIQVHYFTDPICSTCWIIQPLLRKLQLEFGDYINIKYSMGGLLPSWETYTKGVIKEPTDAAKHWEEVCALHEMPLDGDVWIDDPLPSSYPPSIAFKAAQMQDTDKAILFLRRIKEMVFLEKKNIIKWGFLENAAFEVGLDSARLLRDYEGKAKDLFKEDLVLAEDLGVTGFPTLFFNDNHGNSYTIKGYKPYENFEEIVYKLVPDVKRAVINTDPKNLFTLFPTMTDKEFAFLSGINRVDATAILTSLYDQGYIDKYESKNGVIWLSKYSAY
ncbi:MAG: DsbA family protein [Bacteroidetes bacterium]|nr:DsbA family protein [Bacteroidota bacterium]